MPLGPGKYDDLCTDVRKKANAEGVVLIILHGNQGNGFSVQATVPITLTLAKLLRDTADVIQDSIKEDLGVKNKSGPQ